MECGCGRSPTGKCIGWHKLSEEEYSFKIARELMPLSEEIADLCNKIEDIVPEKYWDIPTYYDMLFIR